MILGMLSLGGGSWWAAWVSSWVAHSGEGAWHFVQLVLDLFEDSMPRYFDTCGID